jgi:dTDP-4-amino-4,6-dideoxygalactose transaminase
VAISAYTCPDIAAAAVMAGWEIIPLELDLETLLPAAGQEEFCKERGINAVILSNLFGLPDDVARWRELFGPELLIIDDACQGALSSDAGVPLGCRSGTWGVWSFGRGKAFGGPGGGALLAPKDCSIALEAQFKGVQGVSSETRDLFVAACSWLFERPQLFGLAAKLPFIGLGETHFCAEIPKRSISTVAASCLGAQVLCRDSARKIFRQNSKSLKEALEGLDVHVPLTRRSANEQKEVVLIRFPIILPSDKHRDAAFSALNRAGLGASVSYGRTLQSYQDLQGHLITNETPTAEQVARRILTLPVHRYVRGNDILRIGEILKNSIQISGRSSC